MSDNDNSIELKIGNAALSVSGSQEFVEEHFYDLYNSHGFEEVDLREEDPIFEKAHESQNEGTEGWEKQPKGKTLNEYLADSEASTKQDNALVIGWYLEKVEDHDDFTPSEVKEKGDSSKVPLGVKLKRDLDKNVQKGYLHSPGEREGEEAYWVTDSGEEYLEELGISV